MTDEDLLYSYIIIKGKFSFPKTVKFPSIPCFVDKDTTAYPLSGECVLTGAEYIVARNQGCEFRLSDIYYMKFNNFKHNDQAFYESRKESGIS